MSQQLAVFISGDTTALVTYHYPRPFSIEYTDPYTPKIGYKTTIDGIEYKFHDNDALETFFSKRMIALSISPDISNILLLKSSYQPVATHIYGADIKLIQRELDKLPRKKYSDVKQLINDCLPVYD